MALASRTARGNEPCLALGSVIEVEEGKEALVA